MRTLKREAEASICLGLKERLSVGVRILERIDENRARSHAPGLGMSIERQIVNRELRELELDANGRKRIRGFMFLSEKLFSVAINYLADLLQSTGLPLSQADQSPSTAS